MICTVYWGRDGLVLVPDCMIASREAERAHGPLRRCGAFETDLLSEDLAARVASELDQRSFVLLPADLAMRLGYEPSAKLPLPEEFEWAERDWWDSGGELTLLCKNTAVAFIRPDAHAFGWTVATNCHKPWAFQSSRISTSRAAAMQFVSAWADGQAESLRREVLSLLQDRVRNPD